MCARAHISSAITGGRGLKRLVLRKYATKAAISSAITGGRGLKLAHPGEVIADLLHFVRHYWRTWIETYCTALAATSMANFVRHYWRTWIETDPLALALGLCAGFRPPLLADED